MLDKVYLENLDSMWPDDLVGYADRLSKLQLTGEDAVVRDQLVHYAKRKAQAMRARASGTIATALQLEAGCDAIYQSLPDWAKW